MKSPVWIKENVAKIICRFKGDSYCDLSEAELTGSVLYNALTPTDQADLGEYENALSHALKNEDIKNIAVTGPYGSGKSSILRTFQKKHSGSRGYEFLNISLANFDFGNPELDDEKRIKLNSDVEKSLLQQIFFKVTANELEDSHFSRLQIKKYKLIPLLKRFFLTSNLGTAFFLVVFIISLMFVLKPEYEIFKNNILLIPKYENLFKIFVLISGIALLQQVFNAFPKLGLNKLGAGGAEISFNEKRGDSILNKFIDELIYFFVKTKYNIVVFEDLDRFPSRDIFIKLREINTLLNYSDEVLKKGKLIKFIFVLGDDVFQNAEDRTKFFDFIIPVIPIINSFNAEEKLRSAVSNAFKEHSVNKTFFEDVALFIDDMRMLINIANEFVIYKKMLDASSQTDVKSSSKVKLDDTKLLSLIVYKNQYPEDFKQLNYRKGFVANIFANISKFRTDLVSSLQVKIDKLNEKLTEIDNEKIDSLEELRLIYLAGYFRQVKTMTHIRINNTYHDFAALLNDDFFNSLISQSSIDYMYSQNRYTNTVNLSFNEIEKAINPRFSYKQRKQNIIDKTSSIKSEVIKQISILKDQIEHTNSLKIKHLIELSSGQNFLDLQNEEDSNDLSLIRFLIVNGHIEEDYDSYMSYFYPGELSTNDKQFLISLANHNPLDFKYKLDNVEKVYQRIQPERFKIRAVLNFDLLDYLLNKEANSIALENVLNLIIHYGHDVNEFVIEYLLREKLNESKANRVEHRILFNKLSSCKKQYWKEFFESLDNEQVVKDKLLHLFLENVSIKNLPLVNEDGFFSHYIADTKTIFEILGKFSLDRITEVIEVLNIKFTDLTECNDKNVLKLIEDLNAYHLSQVNITKIIKTLNENVDADISASYTCILESKRLSLIGYVNENLEYYVQEVLFAIENSVESEIAISMLLNAKISTELSTEIIQNLNFKISNIGSIENNQLWDELFKQDRVDATWSNVIRRFEVLNETLDEHLISFMNLTDNSLKLGGVRMDSKEKNVGSISRKVVYSDEFSNEAYRNLIKSIPFWYPDLSDLDISIEKIEHLLTANIFQVTEANHVFLKKKIPEHSYQLIEKNYSLYMKDTSNIELECKEYKNLIDSANLKNLEKLAIVKSVPDEIYDFENELVKTVCGFIIHKTTEKPFSVELTEKLLGYDIGFELKVKLFNRYSADFEISRLKNIVSKLDDLGVLTNNKRPKILNNDDNHAAVTFLASKQLLSYRIRGKQINLTPKSKILN